MKISSNLYSLFLITGFLALGQSAQAAVIANYDFDPNNVSGTQVDVDNSAQTNWTTSILLDNATGTGALGLSNQDPVNRDLAVGTTGNYLAVSAAREIDTGVPNGPIGESTWFTFDVTPSVGTTFDFSGQTASIDTYALNTLAANLAASNWTLYFSLNGGSSYTSLGTFAGASASPGTTSGPVGLSWNLTTIGTQTGTVTFLLDPVNTGGTNGAVTQRATGFDNLIINADVITSDIPTTPEPSTLLGLLAVGSIGVLAGKGKKS